MQRDYKNLRLTNLIAFYVNHSTGASDKCHLFTVKQSQGEDILILNCCTLQVSSYTGKVNVKFNE